MSELQNRDSVSRETQISFVNLDRGNPQRRVASFGRPKGIHDIGRNARQADMQTAKEAHEVSVPRLDALRAGKLITAEPKNIRSASVSPLLQCSQSESVV